MATANALVNANGRREIIRFHPNVPTLIKLDHDDGTPSPGAYGDQWRYTVNDGRAVFWVDPAVRDLIRASGASAGDQIVITKAQANAKARARWTVEKVEDEPPQPTTEAASAARNAPPQIVTSMAAALASAFDACVSVREYAGAKGYALTFDFGDIRAIAATLYIQSAKGGQ